MWMDANAVISSIEGFITKKALLEKGTKIMFVLLTDGKAKGKRLA